MNTTIPLRKNMPTSGSDLLNGSGVAGATVDDALDTLNATKQPLDGMLTGLSAVAASSGFLALSAADTPVARTFQAPPAGLTITNPAGVAGDPAFALANDAAALEALSGNGGAFRTGTDTWALRSLAVASTGRLTVTNADGVSGNPTYDLATVGSATGPIGGAGTVPIVTIDVYGRVTALTSTAITGAALTLTDVTTNNVTTSQHGFFPKLDNTATHFIDMTGVQRALATADLGTTMTPQFAYLGLGIAADPTLILKADAGASNCLGSFTTTGAATRAAFSMTYSGQTFRFGADGSFGGFVVNDTTASANRMLINTSGDMSCGNVTSILARMEARKTSGAQLAASYDASNYMLQTVGSSGVCTWTGAGTAKGHVFADGILVGTGTDRAKIMGSRKTIATTSTNTSTGETDLHSITIAANSLVNDGDFFWFAMGFFTAGNANSKQIRVYFGGTMIFDGGSANANASDMLIEGYVMRTGATTQVAYTRNAVSVGSAWTAKPVIRGAPSATLSSSATFKATGQGGASSDITQNMTIFGYGQAA